MEDTLEWEIFIRELAHPPEYINELNMQYMVVDCPYSIITTSLTVKL